MDGEALPVPPVDALYRRKPHARPLTAALRRAQSLCRGPIHTDLRGSAWRRCSEPVNLHRLEALERQALSGSVELCSARAAKRAKLLTNSERRHRDAENLLTRGAGTGFSLAHRSARVRNGETPGDPTCSNRWGYTNDDAVNQRACKLLGRGSLAPQVKQRVFHGRETLAKLLILNGLLKLT